MSDNSTGNILVKVLAPFLVLLAIPLFKLLWHTIKRALSKGRPFVVVGYERLTNMAGYLWRQTMSENVFKLLVLPSSFSAPGVCTPLEA